ncbi:DEAD/DEAH box helicase, partial [Patescibacteria group bacterium]|nr:DEAD/DEAH box helicase [Patescibacteria group bacterium]
IGYFAFRLTSEKKAIITAYEPYISHADAITTIQKIIEIEESQFTCVNESIGIDDIDNLPDQDKIYTHRSGRTGRAQKSGISISIVSRGEIRRIKKLESIIGKKFEYKKIPTKEDVFQKQIDNFLKEIEKTDIKETHYERYFSEIMDTFKKLNKEDLIKHFIALKFKHLMDDYKDARDLNAKERIFDSKKGNGDNVSLEINFGKKHGLDIKGFFALFNSNKNLKGIEIGMINLMPEYSIFSVEKERVDEVIKNLKGTNFKGKRINISRSNKKVSYRRKRRSWSDRGFRKKKRGWAR